jgi:hypothetical protein
MMRLSPSARSLRACLRLASVSLMQGLLLIALVLMASVPQGMMRAASADGMVLVLCTGEGPKELRIDAQGNPVDPGDGETDALPCLAVTQGLAAPGVWPALAARDAEFSHFRPVVRAGLHRPAAEPRLNGPRAPPYFHIV